MSGREINEVMSMMKSINSEPHTSLKGEILYGKEAISTIAKDWDELFERATAAPPYLSRVWAELFIEEERLRGMPLYVLVWSDNKLVGLLALVVRKFFNQRLAEPVGTGQPSYLGLLLDPNYPSTIEYIAELFRQKKVADLLYIADLWSEDKATGALLAHLKRKKFLCLRTYRNPCYQISLRCSYDEYLKRTKSSKRRRELKRNEKKLLESGTVSFEQYVGDKITSEIITRMANIQEESWMKRRGAAVLGQSFHRKALLEMSRAGFGRAWFIKINGSDAGFGFAYVAHDRLYYTRTGFKLSYQSSLSVGKVLTSWLVRDACSKGLLSFDFGHGEGWYKRFWANERHAVYRAVAGRGLIGRLLAVFYFVVCRLSRIKWLHSFYRHLHKRFRARVVRHK